MPEATPDPLEQLDDAQAAAAFRRLVRHLQHRHDVQNIELMGLSGFCRNCLADWIMEAGYVGDKASARALIHGMEMDEWKALYQTEATPEQLAAMQASIAKNADSAKNADNPKNVETAHNSASAKNAKNG